MTQDDSLDSPGKSGRSTLEEGGRPRGGGSSGAKVGPIPAAGGSRTASGSARMALDATARKGGVAVTAGHEVMAAHAPGTHARWHAPPARWSAGAGAMVVTIRPGAGVTCAGRDTAPPPFIPRIACLP